MSLDVSIILHAINYQSIVIAFFSQNIYLTDISFQSSLFQAFSACYTKRSNRQCYSNGGVKKTREVWDESCNEHDLYPF